MEAFGRYWADLSKPAAYGMVLHLVVALGCGLAFAWDAPLVRGLHPASKPLKFAFSIALFLGTMAWVLPRIPMHERLRDALSVILAVTMLCEMTPVAVQALRGTTSHFNTGTPLDAAVWSTMVGAIVVATATMVVIALLATAQPLLVNGAPASPSLTLAVRSGLWLFLVAAYTGFAMGGRGRHSIGGDDGGPGAPLTNFSVEHGDLRVGHFLSLHGLQVLPLLAFVLSLLPVSEHARWLTMLLSVVGYATFTLLTIRAALEGRPALFS
jgi:hypothetical protein